MLPRILSVVSVFFQATKHQDIFGERRSRTDDASRKDSTLTLRSFCWRIDQPPYLADKERRTKVPALCPPPPRRARLRPCPYLGVRGFSRACPELACHTEAARVLGFPPARDAHPWEQGKALSGRGKFAGGHGSHCFWPGLRAAIAYSCGDIAIHFFRLAELAGRCCRSRS